MSIAIVTGGSRGLGRALTAGLLAEGWEVIIDGRNAAALAAAAAELRARAPGRLVALAGDVTDEDHRQALLAEAERRGGLDLLVNNAGILGPSPLPAVADVRPEDLRQVLEVNLVAPARLLAQALPQLRARAGAAINITSDAAVEPYPGWGAYGAAKAGIEQLGAVLGAEEPEVRSWTVDPGDLRTDMHQLAFPGEDISDRPRPEAVVPAFVELVRRRPPSGRYRLSDLALPAPGVGAQAGFDRAGQAAGGGWGG
jgi:NAD(P)-dependent dehydrogenase (short-subunit alcohol dehydrogenase family)